MRSISTSATRTLLALIAAGVALAAWASITLAAEGEITVRLPSGQGGGSVPVSLEELTGGVDGRYVVRGRGGVSRKNVVDGIPIADVLEAAGVDPHSFGRIEIERPTGGQVVLSRAAIYDAGPLPPVFYEASGELSFVRHSTGKRDLNAADAFALPDGAMTVQLYKGGVLGARIRLSPKDVKAGEEVTLSAVVSNAPSGRRVTYSWSFGEGRTASGEEVKHTFSKERSYPVTLTVAVPSEDLEAFAELDVEVGGTTDESPDGADGSQPGLPPIVNTDPGVGSSPDSYAPIPSPTPPGPAPAPGGRIDPDLPSASSPIDEGMIEGTLLADASTSPPPAAASALEAANFVAPEPADGVLGVPAAVWVLVGTLTLLGFGAGVEALSSRRPPLHPPPESSS